MRACHDILLELSNQKHPRLLSTRQGNTMHADGLFLAEDTDTVFASLEIDCGCIGAIHFCLTAYFLQTIDASVASSHAVNLLNGCHLCVSFLQDAGNSLVVNFAVQSFTMLYIIRCKVQGTHPLGLGGQNKKGCQQCRRQPSYRSFHRISTSSFISIS